MGNYDHAGDAVGNLSENLGGPRYVEEVMMPDGLSKLGSITSMSIARQRWVLQADSVYAHQGCRTEKLRFC